jgi:methionyl-tRNA formyltransferase
VRAIIIGAVESSRVAVEALGHTPGWHLPLVISLAPHLAHRHSDFVDLEPGVRAAGADFLGVSNVNNPDVISAIKKSRPDFVFVIGWSQICGPEFRSAAPDRMIGYHPAPLPRFRGRAAIPWTILSGDAISGGTLFWMDEGVDTGPILAQKFFHVAPQETAATLYAKHMTALREMMGECLVTLLEQSPPRIEQDEACATWATKRSAADGQIDWTLPTPVIERLIRAVGHPYPGATTWDGSNAITVWSAEIDVNGPAHLAVPGQIVAQDAHSFSVKCGDGGALRVTQWSCNAGLKPSGQARLGERQSRQPFPNTQVVPINRTMHRA